MRRPMPPLESGIGEQVVRKTMCKTCPFRMSTGADMQEVSSLASTILSRGGGFDCHEDMDASPSRRIRTCHGPDFFSKNKYNHDRLLPDSYADYEDFAEEQIMKFMRTAYRDGKAGVPREDLMVIGEEV